VRRIVETCNDDGSKEVATWRCIISAWCSSMKVW